MRSKWASLTILGAAVLIVGFWPAGASATTPLGPFCFSNAPFTDVLVFFFDGTAFGNQFQGTGREFNTNRPTTVMAFTTGTTAVIGYHILPTQATPFDQIGGAVINISSLTGPGFCERTNSALGCGTGTNITLTLTACPAGVTSSPAGPTGTSQPGNPG